jgi:general secretion pathway protein D
MLSALGAKTKDGDRHMKLGERVAKGGNCDFATTEFEAALRTDVTEPRYIIAYQTSKQSCFIEHLDQGRKLRAKGALSEAAAQFKKALATDPSSTVAAKELIVTNNMITSPTVLSPNPSSGQQNNAETQVPLAGAPELRPLKAKIDFLKVNDQTARQLYQAVGSLAGINVIFDPGWSESNQGAKQTFNLNLHNTTLSEALDYLTLLTHTFWQAVGRNSIVVAQDTEPKRQEYETELVKIFYLNQSTTPNELADIVGAVKAATKTMNGIFANPSQNAILMRGTASTLALANKVIRDLDQEKAEVVLDVMVVETSSSKMSSIGAALTGANGGLSVPITFSPSSNGSSTSATGATSSPAGVALSHLPHLSSHDFQLALPGAMLQAILTDSSTRLLQRPQLRTTDGGKATLRIGSKIPYVSGSLTAAAGSPSSIPYATTTFQQIDVGVNLDFVPHVNGSDIGMHVRVELSNVVSTETIGGVQEPIIGQRVDDADINLRDGETSLLGGLSSATESKTISGIPGLVAVPLLKYLGGSQSKDRENDCILIALTPHIIRASGRSTLIETEVFAGTAQRGKVSRQTAPSIELTPGPSRIPSDTNNESSDRLPPTGNPTLNERPEAEATRRTTSLIPSSALPVPIVRPNR